MRKKLKFIIILILLNIPILMNARDCGERVYGGHFYCHNCNKMVKFNDAAFVQYETNKITGECWHYYRCPYCEYVNRIKVYDPEWESDYGVPGFLSCFIATATFGDPLSEQVEILREFRDRYLITNHVGMSFVKLYYKTSPPIAQFIAKSEERCKFMRSLLNPIIKVAKISLEFGKENKEDSSVT